jgi:hypothetical protein
MQKWNILILGMFMGVFWSVPLATTRFSYKSMLKIVLYSEPDKSRYLLVFATNPVTKSVANGHKSVSSQIELSAERKWDKEMANWTIQNHKLLLSNAFGISEADAELILHSMWL